MISYNEISSKLGTMWSPQNLIDCLGFCGNPKTLQSIGVHIGDDGGVVYGDYIHNVVSPEHHWLSWFLWWSKSFGGDVGDDGGVVNGDSTHNGNG